MIADGIATGRGEQRLPSTSARRGPRRRRHVPGGLPRRGHRVAGASWFVASQFHRVQVAADMPAPLFRAVRRGGAPRARDARRPRGRVASSVRRSRTSWICSSSCAAGAARPVRSARSRSGAGAILRDCGPASTRTNRAGDRLDDGQPVCLARADAPGEPIFLCAHLDTVPATAPIEPVVTDGMVRNAAARSRSRRQGGCRGDARGDAPAVAETAACRSRACCSRRGERWPRGVAFDQCASRAARLRLRPGGADRHRDPGCSVVRSLEVTFQAVLRTPARTRRRASAIAAAARANSEFGSAARRGIRRRTSARSEADRRRTSSRNGALRRPKRARTTRTSWPT